MAEKLWQVTRIHYCDHVGHEVAYETELIYPVDLIPDYPRIHARRCSNAEECNMNDKPACFWSASNPNYEPI